MYFKLLPLFLLSIKRPRFIHCGMLFASILVNINSAMRCVRDVINMVHNRLTANTLITNKHTHSL